MKVFLWAFGTCLVFIIGFFGNLAVTVETLKAQAPLIQNKLNEHEFFQREIKEDIGHIKGQNDIIIKLLKHEVKNDK